MCCFDEAHLVFPLRFANRITPDSPTSLPLLEPRSNVFPAYSIRHAVFPKGYMQGNLPDIVRIRIGAPHGYRRAYATQYAQGSGCTMPGWVLCGRVD